MAIIAIVYSEAKREYFPTEQMYLAEAEVYDRAQLIEKYLTKIGYASVLIPGNEHALKNVQKYKADMVLNLVDSVKGQEYLCAAIPAMFEAAEIPYTGSGLLGLAMSTNKFLTKKLMEQSGVPVPKYQLFSDSKASLSKKIKFPVISKLNSIHGSVDINQDALSLDEKALRKRLRYLIKTYDDDVLVEEFVVGREFSAILFDGLHKKIYMGEKIFEGKWVNEKYKFATFDAVWGNGVDSFHYKKYNPEAMMKKHIRTAYEVLKIEDYAKFDIIKTKNGKYFFIDSNPNTALGPHALECEIGTIMGLHHISFEQILSRLIKKTLKANIKFKQNKKKVSQYTSTLSLQ